MDAKGKLPYQLASNDRCGGGEIFKRMSLVQLFFVS